MPRFDYECPQCEQTFRDLYVPVANVHAPRSCPVCTAQMTKLPAAPNFTVKGFNAKNGYTKGS